MTTADEPGGSAPWRHCADVLSMQTVVEYRRSRSTYMRCIRSRRRGTASGARACRRSAAYPGRGHRGDAALVASANLLVAVGGDITYYDKSFIPQYPTNMLSRVPALPLYLGPCSKRLMEDVFLPLEMPAEFGAPPEWGKYHTIGQFYAAIEDGFKWLDQHDHAGLWGTEAEQNQRTALQADGSVYYNEDGGGEMVVVGRSPGKLQTTALESVLQAIMEIVEQGEGASVDDLYVPKDPLAPKEGEDEPSHYERFALVVADIDQIGKSGPSRSETRRQSKRAITRPTCASWPRRSTPRAP